MMSWDLIVLILFIVLVVVVFRKFSSFVYSIAIFDILLRLLTFIRYHIGLPDVASLIAKYIPENIPAIVGKYCSGIVFDVILWAYAIIFMVFEFYIIRTFWHKKK